MSSIRVTRQYDLLTGQVQITNVKFPPNYKKCFAVIVDQGARVPGMRHYDCAVNKDKYMPTSRSYCICIDWVK